LTWVAVAVSEEIVECVLSESRPNLFNGIVLELKLPISLKPLSKKELEIT
jgi:hypothetical protein